MRRNIKVKPSKQASIPGFIVGLIFVGIGIFVIIPDAGAFGLLWTIIAIVITITNGVNAFGSKGIPTEEIYIEDDYDDSILKSTERLYEKEMDFEEKLRKLKALKDDGIITDTEYEIKRVEILNNIK
ncbi:SHOCT domain-containing protein [Clostridium nigeriense]|uniref:SHOCT domain-containing protein n=1 Tax=Clostridium nigeriense TaxID=1805470 RepID=UPI0008314E79|nr:SHOCT domain-containing protein [Clostridium nigeriense]